MADKIKSFSTLNHAQLNEVAATFGVDFESGANKNEKISELAENGVTVDMWNEIVGEDGEEEETTTGVDETILPVDAPVATKPEPEKVLIKMVRFNNTYHIRGYQFSRQHPFALVSEEDADYLCRVDGGFTMATPSEAREYYA